MGIMSFGAEFQQNSTSTASPGHPLIPENPRRIGIFHVNVQPEQIFARVVENVVVQTFVFVYDPSENLNVKRDLEM